MTASMCGLNIASGRLEYRAEGVREVLIFYRSASGFVLLSGCGPRARSGTSSLV